MLLTESDAKTKWCPFARVADCPADNAVASNRSCMKEVNYNCIASDCMAWRWQGPQPHGEGEELEPGEPRGYCGLAGDSNG